MADEISARSARDRDEQGRARNARPRDGLGRPLPHGARGVERLPEGVTRTPSETVAEAQRLLDAGMPFHAHEVFEDAWKSADDPADCQLWKGLAQLAVGLTHAARGNPVGAARLLRRGADTVSPHAGSTPYGVDVDALTNWAHGLASALDTGDPRAGAASMNLCAE